MRILSLLFFFCVFQGLSQTDGSYINSAALSYDEFSYAIGEIFVTENRIVEEIQNPPVLLAKISPNPVINSTSLEIQGTLENKTLYIYDIMGRIVKTKEANGSLLDLSKLTSGVYFIKSVNDEFSPIRFIKR